MTISQHIHDELQRRRSEQPHTRDAEPATVSTEQQGFELTVEMRDCDRLGVELWELRIQSTGRGRLPLAENFDGCLQHVGGGLHVIEAMNDDVFLRSDPAADRGRYVELHVRAHDLTLRYFEASEGPRARRALNLSADAFCRVVDEIMHAVLS